MKQDIKKLLREAAGDVAPTQQREAAPIQQREAAGDSATEQKTTALTDKIKELLMDDMFNNSEVMDRMGPQWDKENSSNRSTFRKKKEEEDGKTFSPAEEKTIWRIISDFSGELNDKIGTTRRKEKKG